METLEALGLALGFAGVLNAFLVAAILVRQHRAGLSRVGGVLALLLILLGMVFAIIVAEHANWIPFHWELQALEMALALAIAPVVLFYVSRALDIDPPGLWPYIPLGAFLIYAAVRQQNMFASLGYGHILPVQIAFLAWAAWLVIKWHRSTERNEGERESAKYVGRILFLFLILYFAETLRTVFPDSPYLRDVVPITGAISVLILTFLALAESRVLMDFGASGQSRKAPAPGLFDQLETLVKDDKLYLDARLSLDDLAARLGVGARTVSRLINEYGGKSFAEYFNSFRLQHAIAMLTDPAEARTSVEAVGLLSGFGSRSSFYVAFAKAQGQSPAEYRDKRAAAENDVLNHDAGQSHD